MGFISDGTSVRWKCEGVHDVPLFRVTKPAAIEDAIIPRPSNNVNNRLFEWAYLWWCEIWTSIILLVVHIQVSAVLQPADSASISFDSGRTINVFNLFKKLRRLSRWLVSISYRGCSSGYAWLGDGATSGSGLVLKEATVCPTNLGLYPRLCFCEARWEVIYSHWYGRPRWNWL